MTEPARVIPIDKKRKNLEERLDNDRLKDIFILKGYNSINDFREDKNNEKYGDYKRLKDIGRYYMNQEDLLLNETNAAINEVVDDYIEKKAKDVNEVLERQKGFLIDEYVEFMNNVIREAAANAGDDVKLDERLTEEQKKAALENYTRQVIYHIVGMTLTGDPDPRLRSSLEMNKDYENKDVVEAYNNLKQILNLKGDERESYAKNKKIREHNAVSNVRNFNVRFDDGRNIENWTSQYARMIGKEFLDKTNDGYKINKDRIEKAFGNSKSYLRMSNMVDVNPIDAKG